MVKELPMRKVSLLPEHFKGTKALTRVHRVNGLFCLHEVLGLRWTSEMTSSLVLLLKKLRANHGIKTIINKGR